MGKEQNIEVKFTDGIMPDAPHGTLKPVKQLIPKSVTNKPITSQDVEIIVPHGYAYLIPVNDSGEEYGADGFLVNLQTYNKVYANSKHANGQLKFSVKKKH